MDESKKRDGPCEECGFDPTNRDLLNTINEHYASIARRMETLERHMTGGSEPSRGFIVRLDRIEQARADGRWWARTALGVAIGAFVIAVAEKMKGG